MQNLSTFKDYLLFHLLPNYCFRELQEGGGALIGGGAINGENTVTFNSFIGWLTLRLSILFDHFCLLILAVHKDKHAL